jgi:hypothetical protein
MANAHKVMSDDEWLRRASAEAVVAMKDMIGDGKSFAKKTPLGGLSDIELNWLSMSAIFGWTKVRAEQAVAEGLPSEILLRDVKHGDPAPWDYGAVETILPALGNIEGVDWSKPVGDWSKAQIISFAWQIHKLVDLACLARDECKVGEVNKPQTREIPSQEKAERVYSASKGKSLMSRKELMDDQVPF